MPGRPPFAPSLRSVSSRVWTAGSPSVLTAVSREVSPCLLPATTGPGRSSAPSSARGHAFSRLRRSVGPQRLRALVWSPCSSRSPLPYGRITSTWPCEAVGMILEKNTEASPLAPRPVGAPPAPPPPRERERERGSGPAGSESCILCATVPSGPDCVGRSSALPGSFTPA